MIDIKATFNWDEAIKTANAYAAQRQRRARVQRKTFGEVVYWAVSVEPLPLRQADPRG